MPLKPLYTNADLDRYVDSAISRLITVILRKISWIGEQLRNEAVKNGSYKDQTRHLRGSVGFIIVVDGHIYREGDFGRSDSPTEAKDEGLSFAKRMSLKFPRGIVVIVVAGKNYAQYVSAKGYNVLESSELLAQRLMNKLKKQVEKWEV